MLFQLFSWFSQHHTHCLCSALMLLLGPCKHSFWQLGEALPITGDRRWRRDYFFLFASCCLAVGFMLPSAFPNADIPAFLLESVRSILQFFQIHRTSFITPPYLCPRNSSTRLPKLPPLRVLRVSSKLCVFILPSSSLCSPVLKLGAPACDYYSRATSVL